MKKLLILALCCTMMVFVSSCKKEGSNTKTCKCTIHEPGIERNGGTHVIPKNESCSQFNKEWWEDGMLCSIKCVEK